MALSEPGDGEDEADALSGSGSEHEQGDDDAWQVDVSDGPAPGPLEPAAAAPAVSADLPPVVPIPGPGEVVEPPIAEAALVLAGGGGGGGGGHGPLGPEHERPRVWDLGPALGKLVYEPQTHILAAHCANGGKYGAHGPVACRFNRKCTAAAPHMKSRAWQGRPIGLLVAWLKAQDLEICNCRQSHFALVSERHESVNFAARQEARAWLSTPASGLTPDQLASLLALERPAREGEGPEPEVSL